MAVFSRTAFLLVFIAVLAGCQSGKRAREEQIEAVLMYDKGVAVYAAGDIAACKNQHPEESGAAKTAALISSGLATDNEAIVLTLGDNTYPVGHFSEFTDCYASTWGRFKARTYPAPGNHDYYTPHAAGYFAYFGDTAGPAHRGYYSFNVGSWHVVSLNSNLNLEEHLAQLAWLKNDLDQNKTHCTLAYWHHPMFSSGGHGNDPRMEQAWKILHAADADLILTSHDHNYERFAPLDEEGRHDEQRGMRQFVVGTGGAKLTPLRIRRFNSDVSDNSTHGVIKLVLKKAGYEWEFLPVEKDGFTDRGVALCH